MRYVLLLAACTFLILSVCSPSPVDIAGGSTSTPNEIVVGCMFFSDGSPAGHTEVLLVPSSYTGSDANRPSGMQTDTTDTSGTYRFTRVDTGTYNIQAVHLDNRTRALVTDITTGDDTVYAPSAVLEPAGNLMIILPDASPSENGRLVIPGTTISTDVDGTRDTLMLDSVPAGTIPEVVFVSSSDTALTTLRFDIPVTSGGTTVVRNPSWQYSRAIILNTAASGAAVTGTVTDFPVCIRLNEENFTFPQAAENGRDIRFTTSEGTPLPFEIELWDSAGSQAVIWVKTDTLYGNNDTQSITMYWGNTEAETASNSEAVFDTANGYVGVWHLNEAEGTVEDATANRYAGNRFGNQSQTESPIGFGQSYLSKGDFSDMGNVLNPGVSDMTTSAWIQFTVTGETYTIIGKSNGGEGTEDTYGWLMTFSFNNLRFMIVSQGGVWGDPGTFWTEANTPLDDTGGWHHVATVIDRTGNANCRLFVDGVDVTGTQLGDITDVGIVENSLPLRIGAEADEEYPLKSYLDEVTVSYTARSADWIKLCYMNQRTDDRLVQFAE